MIHFLDSSALVKRYVEEPGSEIVATLFRGRKQLAASRIAEIEVATALARRVRAGDLGEREGRAHAEQVLADLLALRVVELRPRTLELARTLAWRHPLRAYDALQLASALRLRTETGYPLTFWCADEGLNASARVEGLRGGAL